MTDAYRKSVNLVITPEVAKEMRLPAGFVGMTIAEVIAIGQAKAAIKGSTIAAREIGDRIEGRFDAPEADKKLGGITVIINAPRPNYEEKLRLQREAIEIKALPEAE